MGTITIPPPTPKSALNRPAARPTTTRPMGEILRSVDAVARLAETPERAAVILDVDGTLAPIVPRPEDAAVPPETRAELERIAGRYRLLAFVSGRMGEDARRMVGLDGAEYVGV